MTLITYLTRVHFADGVLEEALHSELERHGKLRPLIIAEQGELSGAIADRFFSSFPIRTSAETFIGVPAIPTEAAAGEVARIYHHTQRDVLLAFGSSRAIDLAKAARVAIAYDEPISALSREEGGSQRIGEGLPDLIAIPGIAGFASAVSDYARVKLTAGGQVMLSSPRILPLVTICDPTLTLGSTPVASASAASGVISRGVESYLSRGFNPPADGLALDGLSRIVRNIRTVLDREDLDARRETMAGSLNSALSLQKGLCVVHAITNALAASTAVDVDPCAVGRLLMPHLVRHYGDRLNGKSEPIKQALGLSPSMSLADGLTQVMADYPLPNRLSDMGVLKPDLAQAATLASRDRAIGNGPRSLSEQDIHAILSQTH